MKSETQRQKAYREAVEPHKKLGVFESHTTSRCCQHCFSYSNLEVDHKKPFVKLLNDFEETYEFDSYPSVRYNPCCLNRYEFVINSEEDTDFVSAWVQCYTLNAVHQTLCSSCNKKKSSGGVRYQPRYKSEMKLTKEGSKFIREWMSKKSS